ncbi:uncharacterized protein J7T54_008510 [Emericellopsis cladophorae]|uniref:Anaphase-promoting complex subunit 5 n=1 Tax=Emericellopsis cladophorae TaxID=2686198 RepID=A0A9Q0BCQ8_9HYPO|nr:uncharacterized protein J7T54_008510 [Emericellopsis cladophorae]KAI6780592.1 hypothetical protein J7T54_008510 [Emericellopsis cladophorae]
MARYLTPAKIGLLVLIELYTEEAIPNDAILPVLSFITSNLVDRDTHNRSFNADEKSAWANAERTISLVVSIKDFEKLLGSYSFLMGFPGRRLWDQFLGKMWDLNSLNAMHAFLANLPRLLARTAMELKQEAGGGSSEPEAGIKISRNSLFGLFIRRVGSELGRLQFHDTTELWKCFVQYRQPTAHYLRRKLPGFERLSFDEVLSTGEGQEWDAETVSRLTFIAYGGMLAGEHASALPVSTNDVEALLEFQIEQMQRYGARVAPDLRQQLDILLRESISIPSLAHYLNFLNAWQAGDYATAFDLLHRYFDYAMHTEHQSSYQYGLMNHAVLQADFGCYKEAYEAMLETVTTARENKDMRCLNFALNWLFQFEQSRPYLVSQLRSRDDDSNGVLGTSRKILAYLRVNAKDAKMWSLYCTVWLSEAKLCLLNGESTATAVENMVRSSHLALKYNVKGVMGAQALFWSAYWDRTGLTCLANLASDVFLQCHTGNAAFEDELNHTWVLASGLVRKGRYDEGLQALESLDQNALRSLKFNQLWHKYRGILKLQRDLRHNNLRGAEQLLYQLLQTRTDDMSLEMAYLLDSLHIEYLTQRGDIQSAFTKTNAALAKFREENRDLALRVDMLLRKVKLLSLAGRPQRGFSIAINAINIAWRARLVLQLWDALGVLSSILVSFGEFDAASQILIAVIPRAIETDSLFLVAQLYAYLADACMGLAGQEPPKSTKRTEHMTAALAAVNKAFDYYSSIEDIGKQCEMMAKKAMIMKLSGDMELAADYAAAYVSLKKTAEALSSGGS